MLVFIYSNAILMNAGSSLRSGCHPYGGLYLRAGVLSMGHSRTSGAEGVLQEKSLGPPSCLGNSQHEQLRTRDHS